MRDAAQYLRMSSATQPFSIGAQEAAIAQYAATNEICIVATYIDEARSGLTLSGREAMQRLLSDVAQKNCLFTAILVFDVTRWGRFQDVDESAYYEYHCRKCGVEVVYVAEAFRSEHPLDALVKQLKRTMAAEYSRELGAKCRAGVVRAVTLGFAAGCLPCLGFRRQAVAANGEGKALLKTKERKPSATDRVRWVLGPPSEVARVQQIFADYVSGKPINAISRELAGAGVSSHSGKKISSTMVKLLLKNPVVLGTFEWGARRKKSTSATGIVRLPSSLCNRAMVSSIVDQETWSRTQVKLKEAILFQEQGLPAEILIQKLHDALRAQPRLRTQDFCEYGLASPQTYRAHFGGLDVACLLAGVDHDSRSRLADADAKSRGTSLRVRLLNDLLSLLASWGVCAQRMEPSGSLVVNDVHVVVKVARMLKSAGAERWRTTRLRDCKGLGRWLLVMRLNADAVTGRDFFLLPPSEMQHFNGKMNTAALVRLSQYQLCTAAALAQALSELGAQKQLV